MVNVNLIKISKYIRDWHSELPENIAKFKSDLDVDFCKIKKSDINNIVDKITTELVPDDIAMLVFDIIGDIDDEDYPKNINYFFKHYKIIDYINLINIIVNHPNINDLNYNKSKDVWVYDETKRGGYEIKFYDTKYLLSIGYTQEEIDKRMEESTHNSYFIEETLKNKKKDSEENAKKWFMNLFSGMYVKILEKDKNHIYYIYDPKIIRQKKLSKITSVEKINLNISDGEIIIKQDTKNKIFMVKNTILNSMSENFNISENDIKYMIISILKDFINNKTYKLETISYIVNSDAILKYDKYILDLNTLKN